MATPEVARKGRQSRKLSAINRKQPRSRKPTHLYRRKTSVLRAIKGSYGIWTRVARGLDCSVTAVQNALKRPGWEGVEEAFLEERAKYADACRERLIQIVTSSVDDKAAAKVAIRFLEQFDPLWKPQSKLVVEGGDKPVTIQQAIVHIPIEALGQSKEARRALLEALDIREQQEKADE